MSNICLSGSITNETTHISRCSVSRIGSSIIADIANKTKERLSASVSMLNDRITAVVSNLNSGMVVSVVDNSNRMHATISAICTIETSSGLMVRVTDGIIRLSDGVILRVEK